MCIASMLLATCLQASRSSWTCVRRGKSATSRAPSTRSSCCLALTPQARTPRRGRRGSSGAAAARRLSGRPPRARVPASRAEPAQKPPIKNSSGHRGAVGCGLRSSGRRARLRRPAAPPFALRLRALRPAGLRPRMRQFSKAPERGTRRRNAPCCRRPFVSHSLRTRYRIGSP